MTTSDQSTTSSAQTTLSTEQIGAALAALQTTPRGLTGAEATARLAKYGRNAIEAKTQSRWRKLAAYFGVRCHG